MRAEERKVSTVRRIFVMVLALLMSIGMMAPGMFSYAASGNHTITFQLYRADGKTKVKDVTFEIKDGAHYGYKLSQDELADGVSVRSTYYDASEKQDYDLVDVSAPKGAVANGDVTFKYVQHSEKVTYTVYCTDENKNVLKKVSARISTEDGGTVDVPEEIKSGSATYKCPVSGSGAGDGNIAYPVKYKKDNGSVSTSETLVYTKSGNNGSKDSYQVKVKYEDESGNVLQTNTFTVNGQPVTYYAPDVFKVTVNGKDSYYTLTSRSNTITHKVGDATREYTFSYKKAGSGSGSYTWYILQYDSATNKCIGVVRKNISEGGTETFDPSTESKIDGYTVNKKFSGKITHKWGDGQQKTYVYYDPEGYSNSTDLPDRQVTIQYVDIATGNVIGTDTVAAKAGSDTEIAFPDSMDKDGKHYLRVDGQQASLEHSYFSPRTSYSVYYRDEANTEFRHVTVEEIITEVITVKNGNTRYQVLPDIIRYVARNTATGSTRVLRTQTSNGAAVNSSSSAGTSVDGVQKDNIKTPEGNIDLNKKDTSLMDRINQPLVWCVAIAAVAAALIVLAMRRRRGGSADEK
ncbi:MAG: hypothetical protein I3I98_00375 [Mobilibacterium timonense]|uniref:hypothetical protein n=1 Tax=Mobilibacterium timonense TaxID=1871012 RepID=UPI002357882A|nr:hypothetical protein [Mobilibacterium timonense]MBM6989844.1 hypothetical protein [Mobilibacterium timonense]